MPSSFCTGGNVGGRDAAVQAGGSRAFTHPVVAILLAKPYSLGSSSARPGCVASQNLGRRGIVLLTTRAFGKQGFWQNPQAVHHDSNISSCLVGLMSQGLLLLRLLALQVNSLPRAMLLGEVGILSASIKCLVFHLFPI